MRSVASKIWLLLTLLILPIAVFGEPTDHDKGKTPTGPAPLIRPKAEVTTASLEELKSNVKEKQTAGTASWWAAVNDLLGRLSPTDATTFQGEIAEGRRQNLFRFASQARLQDGKQLSATARNRGAPEASEAAAQEIQRRLQDPTIRFLADNFHLRPELAMAFASDLKKAEGDIQKSAQILARLMGALNRTQREALLKASQGASGDGLDKALIDKVSEASLVSLGANADNAFKQAFKAAYEGTLNRNRQFQQLLSNAMSGDAKSKQELVKQFGKDAVLDFISAQMRSGNDGLAVDLAKTVARRDSNGNLFLDLNPDNAAFGSDAKGQSVFLGNEKANDQIRAALTAFDSSNAKDHGDSTGFDPGTQGRLQRFSVGDGPTDGGRRSFASADATGQPKLTSLEPGAALPTTGLAAQPISRPSELPTPRPITVTPPPSGGTPPPSGGTPGLLSDAQARGIIDRKCGACHGVGRGTAIEPFSFSATDLNDTSVVAQMRRSILRTGRGPMPRNDPGFRDTAEGRALIAWMTAKTGGR